MRARIFQNPKSAMQSGAAASEQWVLDFEPSGPRQQDPLTGWYGSGDTQSQVTLRFATREEAIAYANRQGVEYDLELSPARVHKPKAYADNFKFGRAENWTH